MTREDKDVKNPSELPQIQQAWLWMIHAQTGFGRPWDFPALRALERKGLVEVHSSEWGTIVDLTPAGQAEAERIAAWREAECQRLTDEEEAKKQGAAE